MRRTAAATAIVLIGVAAAVPACIEWVERGNAPYILRVAYDAGTKAVGKPDPQRRCYTLARFDGTIRIDYIGSRACHDFLPERRFTGVYIDEFEGQKFIEGHAEADRYIIPCRWISLTVDDQSDVSRWKGFDIQDGMGRVWLVDFIGRATVPRREKFGFGNMGADEGEVLVERMLSARLLGSYEGYSHQGKDDLVTWQEDCAVDQLR
ncbi:MAG: hypothetical protein WA978_06430 [Sphingopyxis granuli]|uniref:hypothetical protein n=1 Tax=Sphingopyxis granuli TaxID=267128 RepID=UPI003C752BC2